MESMVLAGLVRTVSLVLEGEDHVLGIGYGQRSHEGTSSPSCTRNWL